MYVYYKIKSLLIRSNDLPKYIFPDKLMILFIFDRFLRNRTVVKKYLALYF